MRKLKDSGIEWIGKIPENWKVQRAKTLFSQRLTKGNQDITLLAKKQKYGMLPQSEVEGVVQVKENADLQQFRTVHKDDYVISLRSFQGGFEFSQYEGVCSPAYQVFYNIKPVYHPYYRLMFKSDGFIKKMNSLTVGIRDGKNIQYDDFANSLIPVPPLDEQEHIASYLDRKCAEIDAIIAKQQQIIEKLKEYKLSVITEAVTKGLDPNVPMKDSGVEWIGKVPETWNVMRFGRCATIKSNLVDPSQYSDYPQISPESIEKDSNHIIEYKTVKESGVISWNHLFFKGQIIYSKIRPLLNKVTIAPFNGLCSADMYPIETNNNADFIVHMMLSIYFTAQVGQVTETRVKMPKINQNELNAIIVAIPPLKEQTKIADYLHYKNDTIEKMINKRQNLIDKLLNYKKALIYETVTGKKEV